MKKCHRPIVIQDANYLSKDEAKQIHAIASRAAAIYKTRNAEIEKLIAEYREIVGYTHLNISVWDMFESTSDATDPKCWIENAKEQRKAWILEELTRDS